MVVTPKAKAFIFAASLLLVSTAMVGTSIATTGSALRPFAAGEGYADERSLTRGHHVALGVSVQQVVSGELQPVPGATVVVSKPGNQDPVATKDTDEKGIAIFELRPGAYEINVTKGDLNATEKVPLGHSTRVAVVFDESGEATWDAKDHKAMEQRGESAPLAIRISENGTDGPTPVAGAVVRVYAVKEDGSRELVQEGETNRRGFIQFQLHKGPYVLNFTAGDVSSEKEGALRGPTAVGVMIDGDDVHWRVGKMQEESHGSSGQGGRPTARPSPSRPPHGGGSK